MSDPIQDGFWFRFIGMEPVKLENGTSSIKLEGRAIYCILKTKKGFELTLPPLLGERFPIEKGFTELLLKSSKPYKGKIEGKSVQEGRTSIDQFQQVTPQALEEEQELDDAESSTPKIPGSVSVELEPLVKPRKTSFGMIMPPAGAVYDLIVAAFAHVGLRKPFKRPISVGVSVDMGCSIVRSFNPVRGYKENVVVINAGQLRQLFGTVTPKVVGQVITHELGHYIVNNKVMKQTELMKFKKAVAARGLHPDQFNHPGYSYPWWDEAWAMLCEAMVHGHSCRGFKDPTGWEIAERYFVNRFLKNGNYTGRTEPSR